MRLTSNGGGDDDDETASLRRELTAKKAPVPRLMEPATTVGSITWAMETEDDEEEGDALADCVATMTPVPAEMI